MGKQKTEKADLGLKHMVAGSCAGVFSKTIVQPLDLIKTRMQVNATVYGGVFDAFRQILRSEGLTGLYTGLAPNLLGSGVAWGVYFFVYNSGKSLWRQHVLRLPVGDKTHLGPLPHMLCAASAGVCTSLATNPIWLVKTRLQVQSKNPNGAQYRGIVDCFARIVREEGPFALYKGLIPSLTLVSNGALQFMAYEEFKRFTIHYIAGSEANLGSAHFFAMGFMAKAFSATLTYPLQVTRSRLYQSSKPDRKGKSGAGKPQLAPATLSAAANSSGPTRYTSMRHVVVDILRNESPISFYRGLVPHLMKTAPLSALTFFGYETTIKVLNAWEEARRKTL